MKCTFNKKPSAFTLVELLLVMAIVAVIAIFIAFMSAFIMGNCWFTEGKVTRQIKAQNPTVSEVVEVQRNFFRKSVFTVTLNGGKTAQYHVDADILFNVDVTPAQ